MPRPAAIVTASDSGIGKATAVVLAEAGYDLGITWHTDEEGAQGTAREVEAAGGRAVVRRLDLSDAARGAAVIDDLADELGRLDVLVNNAGVGEGAPFLETSVDLWRQVLEVNLTGAFVCAQAAARRMVQAGGGRIVNVTSVPEHVPLEGGRPTARARGDWGF